jgi:hypothetical protein
VLNEEQLNAAAASNNLDGNFLGAIGHSTERRLDSNLSNLPWRGERADPTDPSGPNGSASVQSSMLKITAPALGNM